MKIAQRVTFCAVFCAASVVILMSSFFSYVAYAAAMVAGMMMIPVALELGSRYAWLCYGASALLALFLVPDMETKWLFVFFCGFYPIIQIRLTLRWHRIAQWSVKLLIFNAAIIAAYALMLFVLGLPKDVFTVAQIYMPVVFLGVANGVFVVYDIALRRVGALYRVRLHPHICKFLK